jgi:hypothetical protein
MRGRVSAVNNVFIGASNEIGGLESGLTAEWLGPVKSVVLGGIGTVLTVLLTAALAPQLRRYGPLQPHAEEAPQPTPAPAMPAPAARGRAKTCNTKGTKGTKKRGREGNRGWTQMNADEATGGTMPRRTVNPVTR